MFMESLRVLRFAIEAATLELTHFVSLEFRELAFNDFADRKACTIARWCQFFLKLGNSTNLNEAEESPSSFRY